MSGGRLLLAALLPLLMGATQPRLVPGVSQEDIEIVYSFTGAELLLFGAILYPGGRVPKKPAGCHSGPGLPATTTTATKTMLRCWPTWARTATDSRLNGAASSPGRAS